MEIRMPDARVRLPPSPHIPCMYFLFNNVVDLKLKTIIQSFRGPDTERFYRPHITFEEYLYNEYECSNVMNE